MIKRVVSPGEELPGEGRLARWSRLKQESRTEAEKPLVAAEAEKTAALTPASPPTPAPAPETEKIDDPIKDLPSLESLTKDSDYSAFMREGVPEDMRAQALQKLWASDPAFREPFAFEMHMEDYNATFVPIDALKDSIYRAGRGFLTPEELVAETDEAEKKAALADRVDAGGESPADPPPLPTAESSSASLEFPDGKNGQTADAAQEVVDKSDKFA